MAGEPADDGRIAQVLERLEADRRRRRLVGLAGVLAISLLTAVGMTYVGFTLAELVRQLDKWLEFVAAFLAPNFVDFTGLPEMVVFLVLVITLIVKPQGLYGVSEVGGH